MRDRFYSTADLARVCGVSISTIKRWTDTGTLRCVRTPGGHRKYRAQDVAEAARRLGLDAADAGLAPPAARVDELALLLLHDDASALSDKIRLLLAQGEAAAVRHLLLDLHRHGVSLHQAGELLKQGLGLVLTDASDAFVRRRAEGIAASTLQQLADAIPPSPDTAPLALLAAPGGRDAFAANSAMLLLRERHWQVLDLGAGVSPSILTSGLRNLHPAILVLLEDAPASLPGIEAEARMSQTRVVRIPTIVPWRLDLLAETCESVPRSLVSEW